MSKLADIIEHNRDEITQRFVNRLYQTMVPGSIRREDVIDSLHEFLDEIAQGIRYAERSAAHEPYTGPSRTASEHGRQRFGLGFDMGAVIREYGELRDLLFDVIEESGIQVSLRELRALSTYLISGITDAATHYGHERDEALRQQADRHIGFLAHELRHPLSSMRLAFELMRERGEIKDSRPAEVVERSMRRLGELIDNALIEVRLRGTKELCREHLRMADFLQGIADEAAAELEGKGQRLVIEAPDRGVFVEADARLFRSAVSNLLRNAIKFTREGGTIQLRVKQAQQRVMIEVEDECGGLAQGAAQTLFDPFVQGGQDRSGFGLGLAIAKQAIEAHGGDVRVHDLPGKGCVFTLDLPASTTTP